MPMMARTGPLQDLPLAHFLASGANSVPTNAKPAKRPLSPSKSTIFSPAKRRILHSEGILLPGEASMSLLQHHIPYFGNDVGALHDSSIALTPPAQRADAIQGSSRDRRTPRRPSPKLIRSTNAPGDDSASALSLRRSSRLQSSQRGAEPGATSMAILREMPSPHDRQSVHYPGFDTYQDSHIFLTPSRRTSPSSDNEESWPSSSEEVLSERKITKENIPPRKKAKKTSLTRSPLLIDKSFRSDRSTTRGESRQLSGITASNRYTDGVTTPRAS
ncbi:uncharacterized protein BJ212DRAFT_1357480 [Suillus subaureus]|uniref:Uncharacterized protein n=1 Tax=Suillus subaureus TaxID=48587 RepID=A0A9P7EA60_9AGAM|nr:uncharacterized protein BJ212DRAFT_1357480 [Suillus subaureus]KAG1815608.1 hypothetical protein BJ212DRAFT_1357480 [Suillus subaureus]